MNAAGRLRLRFHCEGSRTLLTVQEQTPPLRVVRAFPMNHGGAMVHLHNLSGGVLGGDRLALDVCVDRGAAAQLTTTGATRLYRSRAGAGPATQINTIRVEHDGLLEYLPDPTIPFAGSRYRQDTNIQLADRAGLFWWETVAPGRTARGEVFAYDGLQMSLNISAAGAPVAMERASLEPALRPLTSPARLGRFHHFSAFYICRTGEPPRRWTALENQLGELARGLSTRDVSWGVSTLPRDGLVVRALGDDSSAIAAGLAAFWNRAKRELYGRDAEPPRKVP